MSIEIRQIPGEPLGFYEAVAEPITHIPANDWATVGARLERALRDGHCFSIVQCVIDGRFAAWGSKHVDKKYEGSGKTPLEALTAALDAAEGKYQ